MYVEQLNRTDGPDLYQADRIIRGFRCEQLSSRHLDTRAEETVTNCTERYYSFIKDRRRKGKLRVASWIN